MVIDFTTFSEPAHSAGFFMLIPAFIFRQGTLVYNKHAGLHQAYYF